MEEQADLFVLTHDSSPAKALGRLLLGLHTRSKSVRWYIWGNEGGQKNLHHLIGFEDYSEYFLFMKIAGFKTDKSTDSKPGFSIKALLEVTEGMLRAEPFKKERHWTISIGQMSYQEQDGDAAERDRLRRMFWENSTVQDLIRRNRAGETAAAPPTPTPQPLPASPISPLLDHSPNSLLPSTPTILPPSPGGHQPPQTALIKMQLFKAAAELSARENPEEPRKLKDILLEGTGKVHGLGAAVREVGKRMVTPMKKGNRTERQVGDAEFATVAHVDPTINNLAIMPRIVEIEGEPKRGQKYIGMEYCVVSGRHFLVTKGFYLTVFDLPKTVHSPAEQVLLALPKMKSLVNKTQQTLLAKNAKIGMGIKAFVDDAKVFNFSDFGKRLLGGLVACLPQISALGWEQLIPFVIQAFLDSGGLKTDIEQLIKLSPSRSTIEELVLRFAVDTSLLVSKALSMAGVFYLSYDKADAQKGLGGLCKLVSCWDSSDAAKSNEFPDGRVVIMTLDADKSGDSSAAVAAALHHSMEKLDTTTKARACGLTTDSGGGGNTESGARALAKFDRLEERYLTGNCTLHNIHLEGQVQMKIVFLAGSTQVTIGPDQIKRNVETLMFSSFRWEALVGLQNCIAMWNCSYNHCAQLLVDDSIEDFEGIDVEFEEVLLMFSRLDEFSLEDLTHNRKGGAFIRMTRGSQTRWWTEGQAADTLYSTLPMRRFMAKNYLDMDSKEIMENDEEPVTTDVIRKTAGDFISMSKEQVLIVDLCFIKCQHRFYHAPHMSFLQGRDILTQSAGCQPFSVFCRDFLMTRDYVSMQNGGWNSLKAFEDLVQEMAKLKDLVQAGELGPEVVALQESKIEKALQVGLDEHNKMFARWREIDKNAFLAVFSEAPTGRIVGRRILGKESLVFDEETRFFQSPNHGRTFDLVEFQEFVESHIPGDSSQNSKQWQVSKNWDAILAIANGLDIWDHSEDADPRSALIRTECLHRYGAFFTNQQAAERANKAQNLCHSYDRKEKNTSYRVMATSLIKEMGDVRVIGKDRNEFRGPAKIKEMAKRIKSFDQRIKALECEMGPDHFRDARVSMHKKICRNFEQTRVANFQDRFQKALGVVHVPSAKESVKGFDIAPLFEGKLQLGKLFAKGNNIELLREEVAKRLESLHQLPDGDLGMFGITKLKGCIKKLEKERAAHEQEDYNEKFFKVIYTNIDDYTYELVKKKK